MAGRSRPAGNEIQRAGWLTKEPKSGTLGFARKRYFLLEDDAHENRILTYFTSDDCCTQTHKGTIVLRPALLDSNKVLWRVRDSPYKPKTWFELVPTDDCGTDDRRVYSLSAPTEEEAEDWKEAIKDAVVDSDLDDDDDDSDDDSDEDHVFDGLPAISAIASCDGFRGTRVTWDDCLSYYTHFTDIETQQIVKLDVDEKTKSRLQEEYNAQYGGDDESDPEAARLLRPDLNSFSLAQRDPNATHAWSSPLTDADECASLHSKLVFGPLVIREKLTPSPFTLAIPYQYLQVCQPVQDMLYERFKKIMNEEYNRLQRSTQPSQGGKPMDALALMNNLEQQSYAAGFRDWIDESTKCREEHMKFLETRIQEYALGLVHADLLIEKKARPYTQSDAGKQKKGAKGSSVIGAGGGASGAGGTGPSPANASDSSPPSAGSAKKQSADEGLSEGSSVSGFNLKAGRARHRGARLQYGIRRIFKTSKKKKSIELAAVATNLFIHQLTAVPSRRPSVDTAMSMTDRKYNIVTIGAPCAQALGLKQGLRSVQTTLKRKKNKLFDLGGSKAADPGHDSAHKEGSAGGGGSASGAAAVKRVPSKEADSETGPSGAGSSAGGGGGRIAVAVRLAYIRECLDAINELERRRDVCVAQSLSGLCTCFKLFVDADVDTYNRSIASTGKAPDPQAYCLYQFSVIGFLMQGQCLLSTQGKESRMIEDMDGAFATLNQFTLSLMPESEVGEDVCPPSDPPCKAQTDHLIHLAASKKQSPAAPIALEKRPKTGSGAKSALPSVANAPMAAAPSIVPSGQVFAPGDVLNILADGTVNGHGVHWMTSPPTQDMVDTVADVKLTIPCDVSTTGDRRFLIVHPFWTSCCRETNIRLIPKQFTASQYNPKSRSKDHPERKADGAPSSPSATVPASFAKAPAMARQPSSRQPKLYKQDLDPMPRSIDVQMTVPDEFFHSLPAHFHNRAGGHIEVVPAMFSQGVNEFQSMSNKLSNSHLQIDINNESWHNILQNYVQRFKVFVDKERAQVDEQRGKGKGSLEDDCAEFRAAHEARQDAVGKVDELVAVTDVLINQQKHEKQFSILEHTSEIARLMNAGRSTSCKSAKDRTSMSATLEFATLLTKDFKLPAEQRLDLANNLRGKQGVRLENCRLNTGKAKYAFNSVQQTYLPDELKPPKETAGDNKS